MLMLKLKLKLKLKKIMLFLIGIHISFSLQSVKFISSDNSSGEIRIWKLNKRQPIEKKIVDKDAKTIYLEDYNEDNNHLALQLTKGQQGKKFFIAIYDLTQSKIIFQLPLKHKANFVRFIPSIKNVFAFSSLATRMQELPSALAQQSPTRSGLATGPAIRFSGSENISNVTGLR